MRALCAVLAAVAASALVAATAVELQHGRWYGWAAIGPLPFLAVGVIAFLRRPDNLPVRWLLATGAFFALESSIGDVLLYRAAESWPSGWVAVLALVRQWSSVFSSFAALGLIALFPTGQPDRAAERWVLRVAGVEAAALPLLNALTSRTLATGLFAGPAEPVVPSPIAVAGLGWLGPATVVAYEIYPLWLVVAIALLGMRYRRAPAEQRRRVRWLLVGWAAAAGFGWFPSLMIVWLADPHSGAAAVAIAVLWPVTVVLSIGSLLVALLHYGVFGIDSPARRRLAGRVLRLAVGLAGAVAAVAAGLLAGRAAGTWVAVLVAAAAMAGVRPALRRLERLADRWLFGARLDGYDMLGRLGATLERSPRLADVAPTLATALRQALNLSWVTVTLDGSAPAVSGTPEGDPAADVAIGHGREELGRIACGPRGDGPLLDEDRRLLAYVASQTGSAVRNLRLTAELAAQVAVVRRQAAELAASRERVVQGMDAERRRLQRDLHDGVQQEVVAVSARLSVARERLRRGDPGATQALDEVQRELAALLEDVRAFAHTIHPPVLGDRGLLEAVEAQAARLSVPTAVRADPDLRGARFPTAIESTAWYALAEALSNVVKHAGAGEAEVVLRRVNGYLDLSVRDDGRGFDAGGRRGLGLTGLADRLDTVGGSMSISSGVGKGTLLRLRIPLPGRSVDG